MAAPPHANGVDNSYSNLEVAHNAPQNGYPDAALQVDPTAYAHGKFQPVPVTSYTGPEPKQWAEHDPSSPPTAREDAYAPEAVPAYYPHPVAAPPGGNGYHPELHDNPLPAPPPPTICGIRRKKFWIIAGVIGLIVVAAAVGGGVGGALSNRSSGSSAQQTDSGGANSGANSGSNSGSGAGSGSGSGSGNTNTTPAAVQDLSIAAISWESTSGVMEYRVYHQPANQSNLFESKWNSGEKTWQLSQITQSSTENVKKGTPLMAVNGYPHANSTHYKMTKTIYYQEPGGVLMERNSEDVLPEKWSQAGFSTRSTAAIDSTIFVYGCTELPDPNVIVTAFYQEAGAGSVTMSRYLESPTNRGQNWTPTKRNIDVCAGSLIAAAPVGPGQDLRMYITKSDGTLTHHPYDVDRNSLGEGVETKVKLPPGTPLIVAIEDNRNRFTDSTLPTCARGDAGAWMTHLILYATPDRKSLGLLAWDCANGFTEQQSRIEKLLKPNRVYLALSVAIPATGNRFEGQRVYVLFDEGKGPLMEEWEIPASGGVNTAEQGGPWKLLGSVPLYLSSTPSPS